MYKAKGKKIPNDIIKDQATRQAFDRVEARLKDIEAAIDSSNKAVSGIVYYTVTAAFQEIPGLNVKLTVDGKHDVFVGLKYAQAATAINFRVLNAAGTDAKATYKFLRNGVAIDTLSFFEMTATGATAVALYLPPSALNIFDSPPKGSHTYSLQMRSAHDAVMSGVQLFAFEVK